MRRAFNSQVMATGQTFEQFLQAAADVRRTEKDIDDFVEEIIKAGPEQKLGFYPQFEVVKAKLVCLSIFFF